VMTESDGGTDGGDFPREELSSETLGAVHRQFLDQLGSAGAEIPWSMKTASFTGRTTSSSVLGALRLPTSGVGSPRRRDGQPSPRRQMA
jgi:hypothetical protein